jgi:hypothetical protein
MNPEAPPRPTEWHAPGFEVIKSEIYQSRIKLGIILAIARTKPMEA